MQTSSISMTLTIDAKELNAKVRAALGIMGATPNNIVLGDVTVAIYAYGQPYGFHRAGSRDDEIYASSLKLIKLGRGSCFTALVDGKSVRVRPTTNEVTLGIHTEHSLVTY